MGLFARLSATLGATADQAVSRLENHDAIAETALRQARRAVAEARVRLATVRRDGQLLREQRQIHETDIARWTARARQLATVNEIEALECLQRRRRCQAQLDGVVLGVERHACQERQLSADLVAVESRLRDINQQRNSMRSRESVARARDVIGGLDASACSHIDEVFDRWEVSIGEHELKVEVDRVVDHDPLAERLDAEDRELALREELALLLDGDSGDSQ